MYIYIYIFIYIYIHIYMYILKKGAPSALGSRPPRLPLALHLVEGLGARG